MTPLHIVATMRGPMTGAPMLDGLLACVVAERKGLVAGFGPTESIEIPIQREPKGRFHLCTSPIVEWDQHDTRFVHRRFPVAEAQLLGSPEVKRIRISAGACRSYRIPHEVQWAAGDQITWFAVGELDAIRDLLKEVTHIGKKRSVGRGPIDHWEVERCESWGDGFPIVREGHVLRPLPPDWPGVRSPLRSYVTLTYPYYRHEAEELCFIPG